MKTADVIFIQCIQDSQDYGSTDEHMVSRVFFDLIVNGETYKNLHVDIKQSVGGSFETNPIEVGMPVGYQGPFNYNVFRVEVEKYFRSLVGNQGQGINIQGGTNVRMRGNTFYHLHKIQFPIDTNKGGW